MLRLLDSRHEPITHSIHTSIIERRRRDPKRSCATYSLRNRWRQDVMAPSGCLRTGRAPLYFCCAGSLTLLCRPRITNTSNDTVSIYRRGKQFTAGHTLVPWVKAPELSLLNGRVSMDASIGTERRSPHGPSRSSFHSSDRT